MNNIDLQVKGKLEITENLSLYKSVVLKPNIVGEKNILTQGMINQPNTKYIVKWEYDLDGATITLEEGCIIEFEGGSLKNGTLIGNNTVIAGSKENIFDSVIFDGTFKGDILDTCCANIVDSIKLAALSDCLILTGNVVLSGDDALPLPSIKGNNFTVDAGLYNFNVTGKQGLIIQDVNFVTSLINNSAEEYIGKNLLLLNDCDDITILNCSCRKKDSLTTTRGVSFIRANDCTNILIDGITTDSIASVISIVNSDDSNYLSNVEVRNIYSINFETCIWIKDYNDVCVENIKGVNTPEQRSWYIGLTAAEPRDVNGKDLLLIRATNAVVHNLYSEGAIERTIYASKINQCSFTDIVYKNTSGVKFVGTVVDNPTVADINSSDVIVSNVSGYIDATFQGTIHTAETPSGEPIWVENSESVVLYMIKDVTIHNLRGYYDSLAIKIPYIISLSRCLQNIAISDMEYSYRNVSSAFVRNFIYCSSSEDSTNIGLRDIRLYNIGDFAAASPLINSLIPLDLANVTMFNDVAVTIPRVIDSNALTTIKDSELNIRVQSSYNIVLPTCVNVILNCHCSSNNITYDNMPLLFGKSKQKSLSNFSISFRNSGYFEGLTFSIDSLSNDYIFKHIVQISGLIKTSNQEQTSVVLPVYLEDNYRSVLMDIIRNKVKSRVLYAKKSPNNQIYYYDYLDATITEETVTIDGSAYLLPKMSKGWFEINLVKTYTPNATNLIERAGITLPTLDSRYIGYQSFDSRYQIAVYWTNNGWVDSNGQTPGKHSGYASEMPKFLEGTGHITPTANDEGYQFFIIADDQYGTQLVFWNSNAGTRGAWIDSTGTVVITNT